MGQVLQATLPAVVAGTPVTTVLGAVPTDIEEYSVGAARVTPAATQAAQGATNFCTLTVRQLRGGTLLNTLATLSLGTTALTAESAVVMTSSVAIDAALLQAGDVIDCTATHTGTGGALTVGAIVEVELV